MNSLFIGTSNQLGEFRAGVIASIVAISGIALLKSFLEISAGTAFAMEEQQRLMWQVIVHLVFVVSGVLLALMDWLSGHQQGGH